MAKVKIKIKWAELDVDENDIKINGYVKQKYGTWMPRDDNATLECSECKAVLEGDQIAWRNNYYCYHCGAKMKRFGYK